VRKLTLALNSCCCQFFDKCSLVDIATALNLLTPRVGIPPENELLQLAFSPSAFGPSAFRLVGIRPEEVNSIQATSQTGLWNWVLIGNTKKTDENRKLQSRIFDCLYLYVPVLCVISGIKLLDPLSRDDCSLRDQSIPSGLYNNNNNRVTSHTATYLFIGVKHINKTNNTP